jgi:hypothetical protein
MNDNVNRAVRVTWDRKAEFWDARMGDVNVFQRVLIGPASERLLDLRPGQVILEVAAPDVRSGFAFSRAARPFRRLFGRSTRPGSNLPSSPSVAPRLRMRSCDSQITRLTAA